MWWDGKYHNLNSTNSTGDTYAGLVVLTLMLGGLQALLMLAAMAATAAAMHNKVFHRLMRTVITFFDQNPSGLNNAYFIVYLKQNKSDNLEHSSKNTILVLSF